MDCPSLFTRRFDTPTRPREIRAQMRIPPLALAFLLAAAPAYAGFKVCNETSHAAGIALGHNDGHSWRSKGWWRLKPKSCATLLKGDLISRYYYLYVVHADVGGGWKGDRYFCVLESSFDIEGRGACEARGYRSAGFFQVDTGERKDWTTYLSD